MGTVSLCSVLVERTFHRLAQKVLVDQGQLDWLNGITVDGEGNFLVADTIKAIPMKFPA